MKELSLPRMTCVISTFCIATAIVSSAQTLTTLYSFDGLVQGAGPLGALVQGTGGALYGTTAGGAPGDFGYGSVFKITTSGALTTLYSFCSVSGCPDGTAAYAGLVQDTDGSFYGTTELGGAYGGGTVFKITEAGKFLSLYSFCSNSGCTDGKTPGPGSLIQATDGHLYGTTVYGGTSGVGTVYRLTTSGALTTLYSFCPQGCADGRMPTSGLIQATNGNFYGDTFYGGANDQGTIFEITPNGKLTTIYSFCSASDCADGNEPIGGLVQASDGNLYGTTTGFGGGSSNYGTVFRITPHGALTTLHIFEHTDGSTPYAAMIRANDGNLYGTTNNGGAFGDGTLFKITISGKLTPLYSFCSQSGCADGMTPFAALVQGTNGIFYGVTELGGTNDTCYFEGCGTVFSLNTGLTPFVETRPASGKVGAKVIILGDNLKGTTSVTFNGAEASFTASSTYITTIVPTGATSGTVEVATPSGTLKSNVRFRVTK